MLTRERSINKYGGRSYVIELDAFMRLFVHETNTESYIIELKEKRLFKTKTYFSFVLNTDSVEDAIVHSMEKTVHYCNTKLGSHISDSQKEKDISTLLFLLGQQ